MEDNRVPNPGSDVAAEMGCTCPRVDNGFGRGFPGTAEGEVLFYQNADCPLHGDVARGRANYA